MSNGAEQGCRGPEIMREIQREVFGEPKPMSSEERAHLFALATGRAARPILPESVGRDDAVRRMREAEGLVVMSSAGNDSWAAVRDRIVHMLDFAPPGQPSEETAAEILRMVQEQETGKLCRLLNLPRAGVRRVWLDDNGGVSVLSVSEEDRQMLWRALRGPPERSAGTLSPEQIAEAKAGAAALDLEAIEARVAEDLGDLAAALPAAHMVRICRAFADRSLLLAALREARAEVERLRTREVEWQTAEAAAVDEAARLRDLLLRLPVEAHGDCLWCERNTSHTGHDAGCPAPELDALRSAGTLASPPADSCDGDDR